MMALPVAEAAEPVVEEVVAASVKTAERFWDWLKEEGGFTREANYDGAKALLGLGGVAALKLYPWAKKWDARLSGLADALTAWTGVAKSTIQAAENDLGAVEKDVSSAFSWL